MNAWAAFDADFAAASAATRIPVAVLKAIAGTESRFNPRAYRAEPHLREGSVGLMQILPSTAAAFGYAGLVGSAADLSGLFAPKANILAGALFVRDLRRRIGSDDWDAVASAYNGGYRPSLGFGARLQQDKRLCLARSTDPAKKGECIRWVDAKAGEFANQAHVDRFRVWLARFRGESAPVPALSASSGTAIPWGLVLVVLLGLWWAARHTRGD